MTGSSQKGIAVPAEWKARLDAMVLPAAAGARGQFGRMLRALPGIYPSVAVETLHRLAASGGLPNELVARILESSRRPALHRTNDAFASVLPLAHPLDYDWRFTEETAEELLVRCLDLAPASSRALLIGTPTVLESGLHHGVARRLTLLDGSDATLDAITPFRQTHAMKWLLGTPVVHGVSSPVVLGDPPWYPIEIEHFLFSAGLYCETGGTVLMALAPMGTRPGIESERRHIAKFSALHGLELHTIEEGILVYQSPLFEQNALRAEGIRGAPLDWRRGDLAIFKKVKHSSGAPPAARLNTPFTNEVALGDCRIRFRRSSSVHDQARLLPAVEGDVLPSVSRRDHRRRKIDVWTSGNRVYRCHDTHRLQVIIASLAEDVPPHRALARTLGRPLAAPEREDVESVVDQVLSLAEIESLEVRRGSRRGAELGKKGRFRNQLPGARPGIPGA